MTKDEAKAAALRWLDEATSGGRALMEESTADLSDRMDHLLDGAVAAVCGHFPLHAVHTMVCCPPRNLAQGAAGAQRIWPPEELRLQPGQFFSYSLELQSDGPVTVRLLGGGEELFCRQQTPRDFARLSGTLETPADTLLVCGESPFWVRGVGLYPDRYPAQAVPLCQPSLAVKMPANFAALEAVHFSGDGRHFERFSEYRRLRDGVYAVPGSLAGQLEFSYIRRPAMPGVRAAGSTPLDVQEAAAVLVPLRLAADVLYGVDETAALAVNLSERYNEMAAALHRSEPAEHGCIEAVYRQ